MSIYKLCGRDSRRKWSLWRLKCSVDIEMPADFELTRFGSGLGYSHDDVAASLPSSFPALTDRVALSDVLTWNEGPFQRS